MLSIFKKGTSGIVLRVKLRDSTTGIAKTGLTYTSSGLSISTITDNESVATAFSGGNLQSIATIGAWVDPTTKAGFKEVDATNHPGLYEIHLNNARFAVSNARYLNVTMQAAGVLSEDALIQLCAAFDPQDARLGLTSLPSASPNAAGGLPTVGTGAGQINPTGGDVTVGAYATGQDPAALLGTGAALSALATQSSLSTVVDLLEADRVVDTSVVPWALVLIKKGSGTLGHSGTIELLRQQLHDVLGGPITNVNTILGQSVT